jgi:streptogramin lyase
VTQFNLQAAGVLPTQVVSGPDGNLWFTEESFQNQFYGVNEIGKMTPNGTVTQYTGGSAPAQIAAGTHSTLWFTDWGAGSIDSITVNGTITTYPLPSSAGAPTGITTDPEGDVWFLLAKHLVGELPVDAYGDVGPLREFPFPNNILDMLDAYGNPDFMTPGIVYGPDGNLWFPVLINGFQSGGLASMTPNGAFTIYPTPSPVGDVTVGPNGNLWAGPLVVTNETPQVYDLYEMTTTGTVTTFPLPQQGGTFLPGITTAPDGNVWVINRNDSKIVRVTPLGTVTAFPLPASVSLSSSIGVGPDGDLWFGDSVPNGNSLTGGIGRITPSTTIDTFNLPNAYEAPNGITSGPDGNVWFTATEAGAVGRLDLKTGTIVQFVTPTAQSGPAGITVGPDGNLWFTESYVNKIGRITPQGVITEFPIPTSTSVPGDITSGPDGDLWFTEGHANQLGRITPQGVITEFPLPKHTPNAGPQGVVQGPDGNLWLTQDDSPADSITRVTPAGVATQFPIPNGTNVLPTAVTVGPDGNLWFTELAGAIAQVSTQGTFKVFSLPAATSPWGITLGPESQVWFTDQRQNRIYSMTSNGDYTLYPIPSYGSLSENITRGPDGNVWFTEIHSDQIGCLVV